MFKRALSAALLCAAFSANADLVATNGKNSLRLKQEPCTNAAILKTLRPEFHAQFKAGSAELNGKRFQACWIDTFEGSYFVTFDDGDDVLVPITAFIEAGI
jgi:hypothetical protein